MCNCIKETDEALAAMNRNTKLDIPIVFNSKGLSVSHRILVSTVKADDHVRGKPSKLFASYCPFCGEKYPDDKEAAAHAA